MLVGVHTVMAQDTTQILFTNVNVFDGTSEGLLANANVLVEGNMIAAVSVDPIEADGATMIDGGGRTLMPGLIDAHRHTIYIGLPLQTLVSGDMIEAAARAVPKAEAVLMRGFTETNPGGAAASGNRLADSGVSTSGGELRRDGRATPQACR
jgi:imidazolonepropionase-like amidohydrolase